MQDLYLTTFASPAVCGPSTSPNQKVCLPGSNFRLGDNPGTTPLPDIAAFIRTHLGQLVELTSACKPPRWHSSRKYETRRFPASTEFNGSDRLIPSGCAIRIPPT